VLILQNVYDWGMKNNKNLNPYHFPYLLLTLAVLFWSGNFIVGRAVRADIPPVALAFWRWTCASLLVFFFAWPHLKHDLPVMRRHWPILILLSVIGVASFNTLVYTGLQWTIALNAFLMQAMMPVLIVALSFLLFREKISGRQTFGVVLSLAGALVIIFQGKASALFSFSLNQGDILIFMAVVCYAGYSVLLRKRPSLHPLSFLGITFMIGSLLLLPFYLWETCTLRSIHFDRSTLLAVGYVAIFPSIVSYFCFNRGVELVGANRAGLFMYLMPAFGSLMAIIFLGESFHWFHGAGILLIATGILLATGPDNPLFRFMRKQG
jgi:drug/metabolite transporter (DMT)-like permease